MSQDSKIRLESVEGAFQVDVKRFDAPAVLKGECPKCGRDFERDYSTGHHYLSYPIANEPFELDVYCGECDHEWTQSVILKISLELVQE